MKQKRAQGECLGIRSRRRTLQAAISHGKEQISVTAVDFRMGKPTHSQECVTYDEYIVIRGERPELKHLSRDRKRNQPRFCE